MRVFVLTISPSLVSWFTLAVLARSLRDDSRLRLHWRSHPHDLAVLSRPKSAGHAPRRICIAKFGYLARSDVNTGYGPNEFDKNTSVDNDTMLTNDPNHNISEFRKPLTRTLVKSVFPQCLNLLFRTFLIGDFVPQRESKESMQSGNRCWIEKEKKEKVLWSVVKERSTERYSLVCLESNKNSFWRVSENSMLMDEISENIFNEELNKLFLRKIQFRENHIWMNTTWRSRNQSEKIQNTHWLNRSMSSNRKDDNNWKPIYMGRSSSAREYICVEDWRWRTTFIKRAMQEVAEKLRNPKDVSIRKEFSKKKKKNNEDRKKFSRSMFRNHE